MPKTHTDTAVVQSNLLHTLGFIRVIHTEDSEPNTVAEFVPDDRHCHSSVQGGFITAWLDFAMARTVSEATDGEAGASTLELKTSFFRPALKGRTYRAEAWVERMGRNLVFLEAKLTDEAGDVVAKASSTAKLSRRPSPPE